VSATGPSARGRSSPPAPGQGASAADRKAAALAEIGHKIPNPKDYKSLREWEEAVDDVRWKAIWAATDSQDSALSPEDVSVYFKMVHALGVAEFAQRNAAADARSGVIQSRPKLPPVQEALLEERAARWWAQYDLDSAFKPENEHNPEAAKIRAKHYVDRGYVAGPFGYRAPRSDIQSILKAYGAVPGPGILALIADAGIHLYNQEYEEAAFSGIAAATEIGALAWEARLQRLAALEAVNTAVPETGTPVTRNFGGESDIYGHSWTTDPVQTQSRNSLGLPTGNTAEFRAHGSIADDTGLTTREALPIGEAGVKGGGQETLVPKPREQVTIDAVTMPDEHLPFSLPTDPRPQ
jgi:hypothetical protein